MQKEKIDRLFKTGIISLSTAFLSAFIIHFMVEFEVLSTTSRLFEILNILIGASIALFGWNGLRLWIAFFDQVRNTYSSEVVFVYFCACIVSGYWAYKRLRNNDSDCD